MTGSHNFLSHLSELPHEHHQPWNNNILFSWLILYWQNLEHSAIFYFRHKKISFMPEVWYHIYCLQRNCWEYVLSLVWRSHESKVGLVPHLFLWSCKYPVLKYSDANMKINCNLLQSLKRSCRFTEGHERHLQVCGVMKWKGYIKFKQVSHISERKLEILQETSIVQVPQVFYFFLLILCKQAESSGLTGSNTKHSMNWMF